MPTLRSKAAADPIAADSNDQQTLPPTSDIQASANTDSSNPEATIHSDVSASDLPVIEKFQSQSIQLVQPIECPTLKSFSRLSLTKFQLDYDQYLLSTKSHGVTPRSKIECVDSSLLVVLAVQYIGKPKLTSKP